MAHTAVGQGERPLSGTFLSPSGFGGRGRSQCDHGSTIPLPRFFSLGEGGFTRGRVGGVASFPPDRRGGDCPARPADGAGNVALSEAEARAADRGAGVAGAITRGAVLSLPSPAESTARGVAGATEETEPRRPK